MVSYLRGEFKMENKYIKKLSANELMILSELFDYNDIDAMIADNTQQIKDGIIDIFCLFENSSLLGELRVMYTNEDEQFAVKGKRAYLFALRIHKDYQGKGFGKCLSENVIAELTQKGYSELTVGVEDDNARAIHIYNSFGFNKIIARRQEEYQGDRYEYNLYLRC